MSGSEEKRSLLAAEAGNDQLQLFVHDPSPRVIRSLLENRNLTEQDIVIIANRKNITADILETIARDKRWSESYPVRLALARNPRSPLSVSLSVARFLRVFDLEEITRSHYIPLVFRHKVESMLIERIPTMPPGNKKTLAKKAGGAVLLKLLQDRIPEVVAHCLNNPNMVEAHLYKVINHADTPLQTLLMIAEHPVWSNRPLVRFSLTRNPRTPLALSLQFLKNMKLIDLRELYTDPSLPVTVKPLVYRELTSRGVDPDSGNDDRIYEIDEGDAGELESEESDASQQSPADDPLHTEEGLDPAQE